MASGPHNGSAPPPWALPDALPSAPDDGPEEWQTAVAPPNGQPPPVFVPPHPFPGPPQSAVSTLEPPRYPMLQASASAPDAGSPLAPWAGSGQVRVAQPRGMPPYYPQHGLAPRGPFGQVEPPPAAGPSHMLGLATILVSAGALAGYAWQGGPLASVGGGLVGGGAVNAYRAFAFYRQGSAEGDHEAKVSATYAVLALAAGGYLLAKYGTKAAHAHTNPAEDGDDDGDDGPPRTSRGVPPSCSIRPAGPRGAP